MIVVYDHRHSWRVYDRDHGGDDVTARTTNRDHLHHRDGGDHAAPWHADREAISSNVASRVPTTSTVKCNS